MATQRYYPFGRLLGELQTGTQLRVWATRILCDHLVRGYTLNQKRLQEQGLTEIRAALGLLTRTLTSKDW